MSGNIAKGIKPAHINKIRKKYGLAKDAPLTSVQFRELQQLAMQSGGKKDERFHFTYDIDVEHGASGEVVCIRITLTGKHLSKNRFDALPRRVQFRYIRAIKNAAEAAALMYRKSLLRLREKGIIPFERASVHYTFYNRVSRDHDNGSETIKRFQDTFTSLGIIRDDDRTSLVPDGAPDEVPTGKDEPYRVVAVIVPLEQAGKGGRK